MGASGVGGIIGSGQGICGTAAVGSFGCAAAGGSAFLCLATAMPTGMEGLGWRSVEGRARGVMRPSASGYRRGCGGSMSGDEVRAGGKCSWPGESRYGEEGRPGEWRCGMGDCFPQEKVAGAERGPEGRQPGEPARIEMGELREGLPDDKEWVPDVKEWVPDVKEWVPDVKEWVPDVKEWVPDGFLPDSRLVRPHLYFKLTGVVLEHCRSG